MTLLKQSQGFIAGQWRDGHSGRTFRVLNPFNNEELENVADFDVNDVGVAIDNAHDTFKTWRKSTVKQRSVLLKKIGDLMLENKEELGLILTSEQGKPLAEATGEVGFAASFFHFFSEECKRPEGSVISASAPGKQFITVREPLGVAAMVCPWNFPIGMPARKIAAAMAAGCTCVVKPGEDTPLSTLALAAVIHEAGVPPGVVNIVPCSRDNVKEVGNLLCTSPKVAILSFTGSTEVGKMLYGVCSSTVKRVALELGGNAPFVVFESADVDAAVSGLMAAKFRNSGQTCVTANRILVQRPIYQEFVDKFSAKTRELKSDMSCWREEIFGPVAAIAAFDTEDEAVSAANDSDRGLAGFFYSRDYAQIWRVARELECGMVGVNDVGVSTPETPFGGYKTSGIGKEGSSMGLDEYSNVKLIDFGGL